MKRITLLIALFIFNSLFAQITITPISQLRFNNASGVPVDSGNIFTVTGIVTVANEFNSPSYIQDNTAGIAVYARGTGLFSASVKPGDSVIVTGKLTHFRGLTQLDSIRSYQRLDSNKVVEPLVLTINDIKSQDWNGYEAYEGMLIRINNVTVSASGTWTGNTNYTITDSTGSMQLRIVSGTNLVGQTIPTGKFDVVGALGAYKTSPPYDATSYQLLPRNVYDIITDLKPFILQPIVVSNVTSTSFKVYFETMHDGNTEVRYGFTQNLEIGSFIDNNLTKYHQIVISGLQPNTRYYFRVYSTNQYGTSEGPLDFVVTASDGQSTGKINVYFNSTVDQTVAIPGNEARGNVNLTEKLIERINAAEYSIDMCVYSFYNQPSIVNALIAAKNRGVKVRIVYDKRTTQNSMQALINAGFLISKRPSIDGIMHNKFFVFDGRDANPANDWVWTGSWNLSADESSWLNNVIEINDYALAQAYTKEFEEMWGSNTDVPNSSNAKFGPYKTDNTPHNFTINGKEFQLYFSPTDQTTLKIRNTLATADSSIYFALLTFTRSDIANTIVSRVQSGVKLRGIIDNVNDSGSQYNFLRNYGELFDYNLTGTLHHKYAIVDASWVELNPYVITGSHNWSNAAEQDNDENTLIIKDVFIANQYMQEFKRRYNDLGGTGTFTIPVISEVKEKYIPYKVELQQNFPNPFNPVTTIAFTLNERMPVRLVLYNSLGQEVKEIFNNIADAGKTVIDFRADGLPSGVYYYTLYAQNQSISRKMVLMK
ncbi:MAG: phospholipase D-like domain-containing protein [Ignavibacteria bacterium]|nr:phospholipase D-like domain-containing protein [Ignavibacteria bacterium]MDH7527525.1 phospholipase D-like domain-containing protein [Ignavibacteria bacterium]